MHARPNHRHPWLDRSRIMLGIAILFTILVLPNDPAGLSEGGVPHLPLELPVAITLLVLLPGGLSRVLRLVVVAAAGLLLALKMADLATYMAFSRPFNPLLDLHLLVSGWHLASGTFGTWQAVLGIGTVLATVALVLAVLHWALAGIRQPLHRSSFAAVALLGAGSMFAAGLTAASPRASAWPADLRASRFAIERVELLTRSVHDLAVFRHDLETDVATAISDDALLQRLAGKDLMVVFVESYGRSAIEDPQYARAVAHRLDAVERKIGARGFAARSGWLTSPTVGGQSWLAHGTLLSGLWVNNQARYDRLVASERLSLNTLFRRAGWRSVAVMPAITMAWPEAQWFGYDAVHDAEGLGYAGEAFNWVTMPDQYTLSAFERLERASGDRAPVMAELALISSHAPWTPIPPLIPWDAVGDGTIFTPYALSGDPPAVVWRDPERVRLQYAQSIDYALGTLASYVATHGDRDLVLIVLGDHQPAPVITGPSASRDVPVHILTADPDILKALDAWDWAAGMTPDAKTPAWPMDAFRARFLMAFSAAPTEQRAAHLLR